MRRHCVCKEDGSVTNALFGEIPFQSRRFTFHSTVGLGPENRQLETTNKHLNYNIHFGHQVFLLSRNAGMVDHTFTSMCTRSVDKNTNYCRLRNEVVS